MKCLVTVGAFTVINGLQPEGPTDALYEHRCITFDAERAARLGDDPAKACSWAEGTKQHLWWMKAFQDEKSIGKARREYIHG